MVQCYFFTLFFFKVEEKLNEVRNKLQSIFQEGNDINSKKKLAAGKLEEREMFRLSCIQELEMVSFILLYLN